MRIILGLLLVAAACSGPTKKPGGAGDGSADVAAETCCCKSNPLTSDDGQPVYENGNRMECSAKQGTCVDDVQCQQQPQPE
jgi:hypothetical protein